MSELTKQIHIVHLIGSSGLYGAERWILALMRSMNKERFKTTLINLVDRDEENSSIVKAARERNLEAFDFVTGGRFNPFASVRLARWAKKEKADIIHGHGYKSDIIGLLTARLAACRVMTTPHGWSLENDRKLKMYENLDRFIFRFMDMVCPLSAALYADAEKYCKGNIRLITNGVDLDEVRLSPVNAYFRDGSYIIGYVGRLVESKDIVTLLDAVAALFRAGRKVRLVLVGDGDYRQQLKEHAKSLAIEHLVLFPGFRPDAVCFLKGFDCFVLPSLSEGTPRCVMEAMALKIPVIASDIPGNRILVSHNETGLLFPVTDSKGLEEQILYMMDQPEKAQKMAQNGCGKVEDDYSSNRMAKEYATLYETLVAN